MDQRAIAIAVERIMHKQLINGLINRLVLARFHSTRYGIVSRIACQRYD